VHVPEQAVRLLVRGEPLEIARGLDEKREPFGLLAGAWDGQIRLLPWGKRQVSVSVAWRRSR
jgi:hypothetical protein